MVNGTAGPASGKDGATTLMATEAAESGAAVRRMIEANLVRLTSLAERLRAEAPARVVTIARGSSDHAATYGKYLIETMIGIPVSSAAPSVASVFSASVTEETSTLCIAISQSGRSPDLLATVDAQRASGAHIVAIVNDDHSPLAERADTLVALTAGPETSVAATKSYITSLAAQALMVALWSENADLLAAVKALPGELERACELDWSSAVSVLRDATNMFVIGRGYSFGIAQEAALKFKETCALHAEAFSAAEVRHGPMTIVRAGFPVLGFATSDTAGDSVREAAKEFAARDALLRVADPAGEGESALPAIAAHPAVEPILMVQSFYHMVNALALARGMNPDKPQYLSKVTETR